MKKMNNRTVVEGYLYSSNLAEKTYKETAKRPGDKYIIGSIDIATDDALTNVISVQFSFISEPREGDSAAMRSRYETLVNIMNGTIKSVMKDGIDNAAKLQISSSIELNEFYSDLNGALELVSAKRNGGGFIRSQSILNAEDQRNTFDVDMIIVGTNRMEANEERGLPEKMTLKGYIFNYRNEIMPVEFSVLLEGAMNYFENLEPSKTSPVFTRVKGHQISSTVTRQITEESAFGEARVRTVTNSRKDWVVDWASPETYEFDIPETITSEEIKKALADREVMLADKKSRAANRGNAIANTSESNNAPAPKYTVKKTTDAFDF